MRAVKFAAVLLCAAIGGCAVGVDEPVRSAARDSGGGDSAIEEGSTPDVASDDSGSAAEGAVDATIDGAADSTIGADTAVADTAVADTAVADTAVADTAVADTAVADTAVADTTPVDTGTADTGVVVDTSVDAGSCAVRGCATGTENRSGCANARTIGRVPASTGTGYRISDNLCSASNKFDESGSACWDANADHAYRIWLQAGDIIDLVLTTASPCSSSGFSWNGTLKIIENSGCDVTACSTLAFCAYNKTSHAKSYTAPRDGWYVVTVEGSSAFDDEGDYTFSVKLTCKTAGCGCP